MGLASRACSMIISGSDVILSRREVLGKVISGERHIVAIYDGVQKRKEYDNGRSVNNLKSTTMVRV